MSYMQPTDWEKEKHNPLWSVFDKKNLFWSITKKPFYVVLHDSDKVCLNLNVDWFFTRYVEVKVGFYLLFKDLI